VPLVLAEICREAEGSWRVRFNLARPRRGMAGGEEARCEC
jgi:hypothetical protein